MALTERELLELLPAYGEGKLVGDQVTEVQALLTSYIDGLLDPEISAAIDDAQKTSPGLAEDIRKARSGKAILARIFPPSDEPLEDPNSPEIQQFIDKIIAKHEKTRKPDEPKVDDPPSPKPTRPWIGYAIAASIAFMVVGAGLWFTGKLQGRLDQALDGQASQRAQIDQLEAERRDLLAEIAGLDDKVEQLSTDLSIAEDDLSDDPWSSQR